jgi:anti-anti-sigma factor
MYEGNTAIMQNENEITLRRGGAVVVFDVQGDGTSKSAPFFDAAYGQVDPREIRKIVLKFTENAYFNSEGIKVLVGLFSKAKTNDQQIAITGPSEHFKKIFHMSGIDKFASIFTTEREALENFGVTGS